MPQKPSITVIIGPTASGKTDFAIQKAKKRDGAIISADSRQIYSGMDIGTAKPEDAWAVPAHPAVVPDVVEGIPHYLLNILNPDAPMTLSGWRDAATQAIDTILAEGKHPIIAGGTMLYVDSLLFNYSIPEVPPNQALRDELEKLSTPQLATRLQEYDLAALDFVEIHNRRRIIRALEVIKATGLPFSQLRKKREPVYEFDIIGLFPGWKELDANIDARVAAMMNDQFLTEVETLRKTYGNECSLLRTMNYKEAGLVLDGTLTKEAAIKAMGHANKRYARRQMRWWKGREAIWWKDKSESES